MRRNRMPFLPSHPYATGGSPASSNSWQHPFWRRRQDRQDIDPRVDGKRMVVDFSRKLKPHRRRATFAPAGATPTRWQRFYVTPIYLVQRGRYKPIDLINKKHGNGGFEKGNFDGWKPQVKGVGRVQLTTDDVFESE